LDVGAGIGFDIGIGVGIVLIMLLGLVWMLVLGVFGYCCWDWFCYWCWDWFRYCCWVWFSFTPVLFHVSVAAYICRLYPLHREKKERGQECAVIGGGDGLEPNKTTAKFRLSHPLMQTPIFFSRILEALQYLHCFKMKGFNVINN
jgi:hypothetical protein